MAVLRPATDADADAIAEVEAAAAHRPWSAAAVRSTLGAAPTLAWVVEDGGRLVAHLLATAVLDEGEILTVAVRPDHRRAGHARALLGRLHATWHARGVARGHLEVRADNAAARALYEAEGWREVGLRRAYYGGTDDAALYAWHADAAVEPSARPASARFALSRGSSPGG